ncbi:hypothetical protein FLONG3_6267 [Fusarium longipes]|uniref:Uncharacterized protein n=1 Tax=Fusarium longipes TaxID=694270 RepID=A0A395SMK3_9HYPO|nr:hypothetical protein FLONG3_6267 [Fusarium longipes]
MAPLPTSHTSPPTNTSPWEERLAELEAELVGNPLAGIGDSDFKRHYSLVPRKWDLPTDHSIHPRGGGFSITPDGDGFILDRDPRPGIHTLPPRPPPFSHSGPPGDGYQRPPPLPPSHDGPPGNDYQRPHRPPHPSMAPHGPFGIGSPPVVPSSPMYDPSLDLTPGFVPEGEVGPPSSNFFEENKMYFVYAGAALVVAAGGFFAWKKFGPKGDDPPPEEE